MMNEKINIIGGSGFIGQNLIKLLKLEYQVTNIDKNNSSTFDTVNINIRNKQQLNEGLPVSDWVVLLAAEHKDNVSPTSLYYDVNVEGTKNILETMDAKNINKIIFTSTVAVYGLNKPNPDEDYPVDPFNHYGISKYQAEEVLRSWYNEKPDERTLIILRPTVVFGPENRGNVYNLLQQILKGNFKMVGNGKNIKSMSYVGNIVAFIKYLLNNNYKGYHLFNYVDKPDLNTNELINIISTSSGKNVSTFKIPYSIGYLAGITFDVLSKITNKEFSVSSIRIKKFCATTQFSNKKIQSTSFKAPYTLADGLDITIKSLMK
jgi:nucleoside-diphosphate-sugar epimerase